MAFVQIIISVFLIIVVLLQQRGEGLSSVFGGQDGFYRTRRGMEKSLFIATIVLAFLFLATAILNVVWR